MAYVKIVKSVLSSWIFWILAVSSGTRSKMLYAIFETNYFNSILNYFFQVDSAYYNFAFELLFNRGGGGENSDFLKMLVILLGINFPAMCFDTFVDLSSQVNFTYSQGKLSVLLSKLELDRRSDQSFAVSDPRNLWFGILVTLFSFMFRIRISRQTFVWRFKILLGPRLISLRITIKSWAFKITGYEALRIKA